MKSIKVNLKKNPYQIIIGKNIIGKLPALIKRLKLGDCAFIITNSAIKKRYGLKLSGCLKSNQIDLKFCLIPDSEKSKSAPTAISVIKALAGFDKRKKVFIIALGGGVVGDLAGFVASVYKRGIPYIQLPTTLLAQVDSSIGGKTAVDLSVGKNLLGAFYQPKLVFSDVSMLKTLDKRQLRAGLAEVIKYAIIKDRDLFEFLERENKSILSGSLSALESVVLRCSKIKAGIVEKDEKEEKGLRTILNFGHTIGHAIEAAGGYEKYNHGEAVALGMLAASGISQKLNLISREKTSRIESLIKALGLPTKIKRVPLSGIISAHFRDKKFSGGKNRFVLVKNIGATKIVENIPLRVIRDSVGERITR